MTLYDPQVPRICQRSPVKRTIRKKTRTKVNPILAVKKI